MMEDSSSIVWRFMVFPGHEYCRLYQQDSNWHFSGMAIFSYEQKPCQLSYKVVCDAAWNTQKAIVEGWVGHTRVKVDLRADQDRCWWLNDAEVPGVSGCTDIDLNFSPSTNTIPIRRLNLTIGGTAEIRAAWLRFPGFNLEPLEQRYQRLDENLFRYESGGGRFFADLRVNQTGFVTDYPEIWIAEDTPR